jgi:transcriptional regulator with XRE-family HTH domain
MMRPLSKMKPTKPQKMPFLSPLILLCDLRAIRESARVCLRDASKASGISAATLSRIELGATPDLPTALRAAAFYERPIDKIWKLESKERK